MKKFNEFVNEGKGVFSLKEDKMIGQDVTITIHKTSNDGQSDLYNMVGKVADVKENGSYIVRMMLDGQLYEFSGEQVKSMEMVKEDKEWEIHKEREMSLEMEFDDIIKKWFGKISGNDMKSIFEKSHKKVFGS